MAESSRETLIGQGSPRVDAQSKVRGLARFVDDLALPGTLHAKAIRADRAHARILKLDLAAAYAHPGVECVVTAGDVPGENIVPIIYRDMPLLAEDVVRYVGEPVALIAATSPEAAEEAARLVDIQYEDLPAVFDPLQALAEEAPQVAAPGGAEQGNVFNHMVIRKGDVTQGFAQADVVVENTYQVGYQEHAYLEPQGALAVPGEVGVTVYGTLQCPFYVQEGVANVLGVPLSHVRIVQTATGGAFGGKEDVPSHLAAMAAVLAWRAGRPVKLILDRAEDIATTSKRHPAVIHCRTGARKDGTLTAVEATLHYNSGAYQTLSSAVLWRGLVHAPGPYRVPHVSVDAYSVATNTVPCGAFRGFGTPQVIFAHEQQMNALATRLGLDPLEIRRRNALAEGDVTATGQKLTESVGLPQTVERASNLSHWAELKEEVAEHNGRHPERPRGLGVSTVMYGVGMGAKAPLLEKAGIYVKLEADGSLTVAMGSTEMGQGAETVVAQMAAEALGARLSDVQIAQVDTSRVPDSGPTVASRTTTTTGAAVLDAAGKLRERVAEAATQMLGCNRVILGDSRCADAHDPARSTSLADVARWMWAHNKDMAATGWAEGAPVSWDPETGQGNAYFVYAYACHIALVEVDRRTGETHVLNFWAVHDSGRIINPQTARGQVAGGIAQGIGYALLEDLQAESGNILDPSFTGYHIPTSCDMPDELTVEFVEAPYSGGPYGAKGLGEVPLMASHSAVSGASSAAVGRILRRYPLVPPEVLHSASNTP
ncbi:MAG: xanthine dehydrogenase family protein molybdopterin-binding subunit [Candidatus Bipolaricaulota bacterium]